MANTSKLNSMKRRDVAYYRQRQKNRVFTEFVKFFAQEAELRGITKKDLALAVSKDPAQITRWLSAPSNFELDTLSDLLLAMGAEMDHKIVRFVDRQKANYAHPIIANHTGAQMMINAAARPPVRTTPVGKVTIKRHPLEIGISSELTSAGKP